jgi:xanthine dehydrogenase accessory factor
MTPWRMTAQIDDIRVPLAEAGGCCAIATLVEIAGSAPRECGAQMLITQGEYWGFLSGGCIEADVARHGREAMAEGAPRLLRYGEGSPWIDIKLACGSGITVLVEPVEADDPALAALLARHAARRPALWSSDGRAREAALCDNAPAFAWDGARYTKLFEPAPRLVLIGEDGAALAAAAIAMQAGMEAALITPGGPDAPPPLPGLAYHRSPPADALAAIGIDPWTAVAVLSHDREDDERGLAAALQSQAIYVGAIGARARLDARLAKLRGHGVSEAQIARLHAPIGLQGFGKAPREIALSLVAEVAQTFHARSAAARSAGESMSSTAPKASVSI